MRHGVKRVKLNRNMGERKALLRSLLVAFLTHEKIVTTEPKAKLLKPAADYVITKSKNKDLATKRLLLSYVPNQVVVQKLLNEYGPRFKNRNGGYSRIVKLGPRLSDATPMARIELVDIAEQTVVKALPEKVDKTKVVDTEVVQNAVATKGKKTAPRKESVTKARSAKSLKEKFATTRRQLSTKKAGKK